VTHYDAFTFLFYFIVLIGGFGFITGIVYPAVAIAVLKIKGSRKPIKEILKEI